MEPQRADLRLAGLINPERVRFVDDRPFGQREVPPQQTGFFKRRQVRAFGEVVSLADCYQPNVAANNCSAASFALLQVLWTQAKSNESITIAELGFIQRRTMRQYFHRAVVVLDSNTGSEHVIDYTARQFGIAPWPYCDSLDGWQRQTIAAAWNLHKYEVVRVMVGRELRPIVEPYGSLVNTANVPDFPPEMPELP